jgi:hypothetical protein
VVIKIVIIELIERFGFFEDTRLNQECFYLSEMSFVMKRRASCTLLCKEYCILATDLFLRHTCENVYCDDAAEVENDALWLDPESKRAFQALLKRRLCRIKLFGCGSSS